MGLFFTAMSGVNLVGDLKADVSEEAARLSLSPSSKSKMIWYAFIARLIPSVIISVIHLAFMRLVFQISLGSNVFQDAVVKDRFFRGLVRRRIRAGRS